MKHLLFFLPIIIFACNDSSSPSNAETTPERKTVSVDSASAINQTDGRVCFAYHSATDTVTLSFTLTDAKVSGNLYYAYSGKDKNKGTIDGVMKGDTLLADYTFMSEGIESVRQVAFLKSGDSFIEGYGDSKMQEGKMRFEKFSSLNFVNNMPLVKQPCDSL